MGWSPWKTIEQLLAEKRGEWTPVFGEHQQRAMDRGKRLEPAIREWYETRSGAPFPDAIAEDKEYPFMRVSYDGINHDLKRIIEIKAPNKDDHALAKLGFVPAKYIPQVQWQLMISGYEDCDYISYGSDNTYEVVRITADPVMQKQLRERAIFFWYNVTCTGDVPVVKVFLQKWVHPGISLENV